MQEVNPLNAGWNSKTHQGRDYCLPLHPGLYISDRGRSLNPGVCKTMLFSVRILLIRHSLTPGQWRALNAALSHSRATVLGKQLSLHGTPPQHPAPLLCNLFKPYEESNTIVSILQINRSSQEIQCSPELCCPPLQLVMDRARTICPAYLKQFDVPGPVKTQPIKSAPKMGEGESPGIRSSCIQIPVSPSLICKKIMRHTLPHHEDSQ